MVGLSELVRVLNNGVAILDDVYVPGHAVPAYEEFRRLIARQLRDAKEQLRVTTKTESGKKESSYESSTKPVL